MWIFTVLPDWVFHAIFAVGLVGTIAGFVLGMIPIISRYALPIRIISVLVLALGIYLQGGLADNAKWVQRANELKAQIAEMESQIAKQDVKIVEKVVTQTQIVKERGAEVIRYVDREVIKYDTKFAAGGECALPPEFYTAYNESLGIEEKK